MIVLIGLKRETGQAFLSYGMKLSIQEDEGISEDIQYAFANRCCWVVIPIERSEVVTEVG